MNKKNNNNVHGQIIYKYSNSPIRSIFFYFFYFSIYNLICFLKGFVVLYLALLAHI